MVYEYVTYDPKYYATNLSIVGDHKKLSWDVAKGLDTLIVQTPFDVRATDIMNDRVVPVLCNKELPQGGYVEILPEVWVRRVTAAEKGHLGGCPLRGEACSYSIFAVRDMGRQRSVVYEPNIDAGLPYRCDVPIKFGVSVVRETVSKGMLFFAREVETGYQVVTFSRKLGGGYRDGDICYRVGDIEVPVTNGAIEAGTIYVKTNAPIEFISHNKGITLV